MPLAFWKDMEPLVDHCLIAANHDQQKERHRKGELWEFAICDSLHRGLNCLFKEVGGWKADRAYPFGGGIPMSLRKVIPVQVILLIAS